MPRIMQAAVTAVPTRGTGAAKVPVFDGDIGDPPEGPWSSSGATVPEDAAR